MYLFIIIFACLLKVSLSDYTAAVLEYQPISHSDAKIALGINVELFVYYIKTAKSRNVQIIVFPENGLTGSYSNISAYSINLSEEGNGPNFTNPYLNTLSTAAKDCSMYVVLNLVEESWDSTNKTIYYNTNIVFDNNGKIVAKYRKINLFGEYSITPGSTDKSNSQVTFTTDFNVTFGIFTCYDITEVIPAQSVLENAEVTDIVYPAGWLSYLPFYHSLSIQVGYATANRVNLLASCRNAPENGGGGSGIYGADGSILNYYISGRHGSKILIANVKTNHRSAKLVTPITESTDIADFHAARYFEDNKYAFKFLNITQERIQEEICQDSFCCQFSMDVSMQGSHSEKYAIMAYKGPINVVNYRDNQRICALLACETEELDTCGKQGINATTKFQTISVQSTNNPKVYFQPFSLTTDLTPVLDTVYNYSDQNNLKTVYYRSLLDQNNILAFGFLGYEIDAFEKK